MNTITITFASRADHAQALKQITKARDYRARGKQLGTLGQGLLLATLERAERVATGHEGNSQSGQTWDALEVSSKESLKEINRIWNTP